MSTTPRQHISFLERLVTPIIMWFLIMAGAVICWFIFPHTMLWRSQWWMTVVLIIGVLYWLTMMRGALAVNRQAGQQTVNNTQLYDRGVYGIVRHPIYSGDVYLMTVFALAFPYVWTIATCAWAVVVFVVWMFLEEIELRKMFGAEYEAYRKRVPMVLPSLGRRQR